MRVIRGIDNLPDPEIVNPVVTLGNFDGVHLGHRKIFERVISAARTEGGTSMVITFHPHPMKVLAPEKNLRLLTPIDQKLRLIEETGIEGVLLIEFTKDFAKMPPEDFIRDVLMDKLKAKHVIIGHNYRFGKHKSGNTRMLRYYGRRYGFRVNVVRNMKLNRFTVSSTRVRQLLHWGRVCEASALLGRPYSIHGRVVRGAGRGKKILQVPTANISTPHELIPRDGVYAVKAAFDGNVYDGVANIGKNPTFNGEEMSYEVHLFGYSGDLLGKELTVYFIDRLRGEKKFSSPEELKAQIKKDMDIAGMILKEYRVNINP